MLPNSLNNMNNRNGVPFQYSYNPSTFSYYNPYQNQTVVRNVMEPQYFNPAQQLQPIYFPYIQQGVYSPIFVPQNSNIIPHNTGNTFHHQQRQNQRKNQQQEQKKPKFKPRNELDPSKPENSMDEVSKWLEARRKNYPCRANNQRKELEKKLKEETGEIIEPALSILEQKLRKKIRVLSMIDGKSNRRKEFEKNYLLKCVTNPFKKVKTSNVTNHEEKNEKVQKEDDSIGEEIGSKPEPEPEAKQTPAQKNVYDIFQEFQMQISQLDDQKGEDGEILEDNPLSDSPIERKCISQKCLEQQNVEKTENKEVTKEKTVTKVNDNKKKIKGAVIKKTIVNDIPKKNESIEDIIENLKQRKDKDDNELDQIFSDCVKTADFRYKTNTLLANMLIDTIYKEKNVILQCLRYIVKENFFDKKE